MHKERFFALKRTQMDEEMTKTLTNMAKRITKFVSMETQIKSTQTTMATNVKNIKTWVTNVERNTADMEGKLDVVNNKVTGVETALVEAFNEMKDVLVKMEDKRDENTRKVRNTPSGDRENIIVAGGVGTDSVEMFNWRQRTWSPLQSLPKQRRGASSFVYKSHVTIAGGNCYGCVDDMIRMNIHPNPDPLMHWSDCPFKLPIQLAYHSSVLYYDHLMVSGGNIYGKYLIKNARTETVPLHGNI